MSSHILEELAVAGCGEVIAELTITCYGDKHKARGERLMQVLHAVAQAEEYQVAEVARVLKGMGVEVGS